MTSPSAVAAPPPAHAPIALRIVVDGASMSGKTSTAHALAERLGREVTTPAEENGRTLWFDWVDHVGGRSDGRPLHAQVVTVPGHLGDRRMALLETADAVLFVADTSHDGFEESARALDDLRKVMADWDGVAPGIVVQANKRDLPGPSIEQVRARLGLGEDVELVETRAADGDGVRQAFVFAVRLALRHRREHGFDERSSDLVSDPDALLEQMKAAEAPVAPPVVRVDPPAAPAAPTVPRVDPPAAPPAPGPVRVVSPIEGSRWMPPPPPPPGEPRGQARSPWAPPARPDVAPSAPAAAAPPVAAPPEWRPSPPPAPVTPLDPPSPSTSTPPWPRPSAPDLPPDPALAPPAVAPAPPPAAPAPADASDDGADGAGWIVGLLDETAPHPTPPVVAEDDPSVPPPVAAPVVPADPPADPDWLHAGFAALDEAGPTYEPDDEAVAAALRHLDERLRAVGIDPFRSRRRRR